MLDFEPKEGMSSNPPRVLTAAWQETNRQNIPITATDLLEDLAIGLLNNQVEFRLELHVQIMLHLLKSQQLAILNRKLN
jgi:hypothetical protein